MEIKIDQELIKKTVSLIIVLIVIAFAIIIPIQTNLKINQLETQVLEIKQTVQKDTLINQHEALAQMLFNLKETVQKDTNDLKAEHQELAQIIAQEQQTINYINNNCTATQTQNNTTTLVCKNLTEASQ